MQRPVARGQEVYTAQKCQLCHAVAGKGNKTNPLDGVGTKLSAADIKRVDSAPDGDDGESEVDEEAADAGKYGGLPAADVDALVAYLQSLK
jgi:mono/diheme cytochrome c family protein